MPAMNQFTDNLVDYPQILDGFSYSGLFGLRPNNSLSWWWACLGSPEMEALRLAADSYRPRMYTVPKNFIDSNNPNGENILPGKTVFYQFQVKPGSWLWGMQFAVRNTTVTPSQAVFSIVVRQGSELPVTERPMVAAAVFSGNPVDPINTLNPPVDLFSNPRLILDPYQQLHVEISNDQNAVVDTAESSVQLLLLFAEPK